MVGGARRSALELALIALVVAALLVNWIPLESVDIDQNSYYQGVRNADGSMDCIFNITRPSHDLNDPWRIRILK